jgi:hypothetical protein
VVLHALDGDVLAILDALRLQNLGKRPLSLLRHEAVLCRDGAEDRGRRSEDDESGIRAVASKTKTRSKRQTGASRFRSRVADKTGGGRPSRQARHGPVVASRAGGRRGRTHTDRDPDPAARASGPMDIDASPKPGPASGHPTTQKRHVADEKRRVAQMPIGDRRLSDASRGWSSAFSSVRSTRARRVTCSRNRAPRAPRAMTTRSRLAVLRRRPRATGI